MTIYHLIRHGESEANDKGAHVICGRSSETPLTEKGNMQARRLGTWCLEQDMVFDHIFTSKAVRAMRTAFSICESMDLPTEKIVLVDDIEEKDQGKWTGVVRSNLFTSKVLKEMNESDGHFAPPEGESDRQAGARLYTKIMEEIVPATLGAKHVAIVSHGNVIRCMLQYMLSYPVTWANPLQNTAITSLAYDPQNREKFEVLSYNRSEHLPHA